MSTAAAPHQPIDNAATQPAHIDPLRVLWRACGEPAPIAPMDRPGTCSRCNTTTKHASRLKAVVSDKFTGWDHYTHDADPLWCPPCTWGHTTSEVRTRAWRIGATCAVEADRAVLAVELAAPIPPTVALTIPISRQKHILPFAVWGQVTTDDRALPWSNLEADRFKTVQWLRALGFNETALHQPVPRFEQLATLDGSTIRRVLSRWDSLSAWRKDPTYLKVAVLGSRSHAGSETA